VILSKKIGTTILLGATLNIALVSCNRSDVTKTDPATGKSPAASESPAPNLSQQRLAIRSKIKAVLTPAQILQLETKMKGGRKMREALTEIELTADQKTKIKEIYRAGRAERQKLSNSSIL
jgi:Spy/CpxP family protein refolding chaperone